MKLTTEEKRYRKSVIFDNEIKILQEKINNLGLSSTLTIKKLYFDYNKTQELRSVCLTFNETFTVIESRTKKKKKLNKYAASHIVFDGSGIKRGGGLTVQNIFCGGGAIYKDVYNNIKDNDILKVCDMLANEYFIWLHWTDYHISQDIYRISSNSLYTFKDMYYIVKYFMSVMWKRLDIAYHGKYTKYSLTELIQNYNDQVKRGLIIDCPFESNEFPFDKVEDIELTNDDLQKGGIYG